MTDNPLYGLAGGIDATEAYLFECDADPLFAVTQDRTGANLPRGSCTTGWRLKEAFALGIREVMPREMDSGPILRGVQNLGYYIWREGYRNPRGTSQ
jgi:hypothetical protein